MEKESLSVYNSVHNVDNPLLRVYLILSTGDIFRFVADRKSMLYVN